LASISDGSFDSLHWFLFLFPNAKHGHLSRFSLFPLDKLIFSNNISHFPLGGKLCQYSLPPGPHGHYVGVLPLSYSLRPPSISARERRKKTVTSGGLYEGVQLIFCCPLLCIKTDSSQGFPKNLV
jgi:hypothetical protein